MYACRLYVRTAARAYGLDRRAAMAMLLAVAGLGVLPAARAEIPTPRSPATDAPARGAYSLVMTNGYGDCYRMNLLRDRYNYQAYRGICSYRGFSLSGCSTTGDVVMLRMTATPSFGEHFSLLSTSLRWGTTIYVLNDVFRPLNNEVMAGYENWYPYDMSCSVAMYISAGGYGMPPVYYQPDLLAHSVFGLASPDDRYAMFGRAGAAAPDKNAYSLVMTNGYGDCYRMNLLRDRYNYQAYRGVCSYRGFSLSGCSTTGEVVMLRLMAGPSSGEYYSLVSTSLRWGQTMYFLNDVFRPLNSAVMAGYENWYPYDMSCSVAMYVAGGGFGAAGAARADMAATGPRPQPRADADADGAILIGALLPLTGDLADIGLAYQSALRQALQTITNQPGMPRLRLIVSDTRTDAGVAFDALQDLHARGCRIVFGPESSEECRILKMFADANGMLLISSSSTAVPLALPEDNLLRLAPADAEQAAALADMMARDGITDIAILARTDIYGEGFMDALIREHAARGGAVFASNYCPRALAFIPEVVSNMADQVAARIAECGAQRVGVVTILFDEGIDALGAAAAHAPLGAVRWYGTDGMAQNNALLQNAPAAEFAALTRYTCSIAGSFTNPLYGAVAARIATETGGVAVRYYPMAAYDGLTIAARVLQEYGSSQTLPELKARIKAAAGLCRGCTGPIAFNDADDRSDGTFDFYRVSAVDGGFAWEDLAGQVPGVPARLACIHAAASQGEYPGRIKVAWTPAPGAAVYTIWGALADQPVQSMLLAETAGSEYWVENAPAGRLCYFWVRAANASGRTVYSTVATGWAADAGPCVLVNGSRLPVEIMADETCTLAVELCPGVYEGCEADWWIVMHAPGGWYYLDAAGQWRLSPDGRLAPAHHGPLKEMPAREIFSVTGAPPGVYAFYFGVDAPDGVLDAANTWYSVNTLTVH